MNSFTDEGMRLADIAKAIHYPECWDTAAYPTLASALCEMFAFFKCTNDDCAAPQEGRGT